MINFPRIYLDHFGVSHLPNWF